LIIGIDSHAAERDGTGNCTYIRGLLTGLARIDRDNRYRVYATDPGHPFYARVRRTENMELRRLRFRHSLIRIPFELAWRSRADRLDLLHTQYIGPPIHHGRPVVTIHDLAFLHDPRSFNRFERFRSRLLIPANARHAARVLTCSDYSRRDIIHSCGIPDDKIRVIPYGTEYHDLPGRPAAERNEVLARLGIRKPFILSLGRLNLRKNLGRLISAYSRLRRDKRTTALLVLAGKKDHLAEQAQRAVTESGYESDIRLTGYVPQPDLPVLFQEAEVFVYPSRFEGFGLPPLEAMACGCPVIASDATSIPEVTGDAAILIDPDSEQDLADALIAVLTDLDRRAGMIDRGRKQAARFHWDRTARETLAAYREAAGEMR